MRGRGWDEEEIGRRRLAQMPLSVKKERADVVIENNGSIDELAARVRAAWKQLLDKESRNGR